MATIPYGSTTPTTALHIALVRGSPLDGVHSHIVWWRGASGQAGEWAEGGLYKWNPDVTTGCNGAVEGFTIRSIGGPHYDTFCAGQAPLGDGRLLVTGGGRPEVIGVRDNAVFDPVNGFVRRDSMHLARYYPTNTTLPNGKILTTGGSEYPLMYIYGGKPRNGAPSSYAPTIRRAKMTNIGSWAPRRVPHADVGFPSR
jgi:hypothetical protein